MCHMGWMAGPPVSGQPHLEGHESGEPFGVDLAHWFPGGIPANAPASSMQGMPIGSPGCTPSSFPDSGPSDP